MCILLPTCRRLNKGNRRRLHGGSVCSRAWKNRYDCCQRSGTSPGRVRLTKIHCVTKLLFSLHAIVAVSPGCWESALYTFRCTEQPFFSCQGFFDEIISNVLGKWRRTNRRKSRSFRVRREVGFLLHHVLILIDRSFIPLIVHFLGFQSGWKAIV